VQFLGPGGRLADGCRPGADLRGRPSSRRRADRGRPRSGPAR